MRKRVKPLGCVLSAIFALSIAATSVAQAAEFRTLPEKLKFSLSSNVAEKVRIEALSGKRIECKKVSGTGEFTSERLGMVELKFTECEEPTLKIKCTGLSDTAGNITVKGEFHKRIILIGNIIIIIILLGNVHASCSIALFVVSGCSASMEMLTAKGGEVAVNKLLGSTYVEFLAEKGDAKQTEVDTDNSLAMEKCELLSKEGSGANESAGTLGGGTIEKFLNSEGKAVTELTDLTGTL